MFYNEKHWKSNISFPPGGDWILPPLGGILIPPRGGRIPPPYGAHWQLGGTLVP